jgi:hypothetical protein
MVFQTVTSFASAGVAALSAAVSVYYSHKATQRAERSAQCQYEDNIRVWAERTVDVTGQLVELLSNEGGEIEFNRNRSTLLAVLRCQIDKGRWYFPNIHTDKKGESKLPAFRGIRQPRCPGRHLRSGQNRGVEHSTAGAQKSQRPASKVCFGSPAPTESLRPRRELPQVRRASERAVRGGIALAS